MCFAARVPVLVAVSRVNEYKPECWQHIFRVKENANFGDAIGNINGTDRDYPFNNIEYSILGRENGPFDIGRRSGKEKSSCHTFSISYDLLLPILLKNFFKPLGLSFPSWLLWVSFCFGMKSPTLSWGE